MRQIKREENIDVAHNVKLRDRHLGNVYVEGDLPHLLPLIVSSWCYSSESGCQYLQDSYGTSPSPMMSEGRALMSRE